MVINNLDIFWTLGCPYKAHAKLIVNADAMLPGAITFQKLQVITRWHTQIVENACPIELLKFSSCDGFDVHKSSYALPLK